MAENENIYRPMEVFWTRDETLTEEALGSANKVNRKASHEIMKDPGNRRPVKTCSQIKGKKTKEVKAGMPKKQPVVEDVTPMQVSPPDTGQNLLVDGKTAKASLKDLCPEDKKRVANLVKELARLGDERENTMQQLQSERKLFERRIVDLQNEQTNIIKDKDGVASQLRECQKLLSQYHQYMLDQEQKENGCLGTPEKKIPQSRRGVEMYTPKSNVQPAVPTQDVSTSPRLHHRGVTPHKDIAHSTNHRSLHRGNADHTKPDLNDGFSEMKPHTPRRFPPASGSYHLRQSQDGTTHSDRPFTNKIDQIIAEEKQTFLPNAHVREADHGTRPEVASSRQAIPDRRLTGLGPLNPPALSSTQRSDYSHQGDEPRPLQEFHPLRPDSSLRSSTQSLVEVPTGGGFPSSDGNNNAKVGFTSPVQTAAYSPVQEDKHFMEYYSSLRPDERKHQLQVQKQQLLAEQHRLKAILAEQEDMLRAKQAQLHKQQEIQQERLKYFEQVGTFPQHKQYSVPAPAPQSASGQPGGGMTDHIEAQLASLWNQVAQLRGLNEAEQYRAMGSDPSQSAQTSDSENSRLQDKVIGVPKEETPLENLQGDKESDLKGLPAQYLHAASRDGQPQVLQANAAFLEVEQAAEKPSSDTDRDVVRSRAASKSTPSQRKPRTHQEPVQQVPRPQEATTRGQPRRQEGIWVDEEPDHRTYECVNPLRTTGPDIFKQPRVRSSKIPTYNRSSELFDLVNEVESELESFVSRDADSTTATDPRRVARPGPPDLYATDETGSYTEDITPQGAALDDTDDEAEESQVLEDIFFVK